MSDKEVRKYRENCAAFVKPIGTVRVKKAGMGHFKLKKNENKDYDSGQNTEEALRVRDDRARRHDQRIRKKWNVFHPRHDDYRRGLKRITVPMYLTCTCYYHYLLLLLYVVVVYFICFLLLCMSLIMYLCIYILLFLVVVIIVLLLAKPTMCACWWYTTSFVSILHYYSSQRVIPSAKKGAPPHCVFLFPMHTPQMWETSSRNLVPVCLPTISPSLVATSPARGVILSTTETISSISRCRLPRSVSRSTPTGLGAVVSPSGLARTQNTC